MFLSMTFLIYADSGRFDSEKEKKCFDYIIILLLFFGLIIIIPLDLITFPIQLLIYLIIKLKDCIKKRIKRK